VKRPIAGSVVTGEVGREKYGERVLQLTAFGLERERIF